MVVYLRNKAGREARIGSPARSALGQNSAELRLRVFELDVTLFLEKRPERHFPLRQRGLCDHPCKLDSVVLGHVIQDIDRCAITKKDSLGIHCY